MQGQWNSNLSDLGRQQAHVNGRMLSGERIEAIYASTLDRTRQTAEIITEYVRKPVTYDERIMEWDCGDWSGHLYQEVQEQWPDEWAALQADRFHYRGPNCENFPDMIRRSTPFLEEVLAEDLERILIVSHGMIGKVMIAVLLELDESETLAVYQPNDVVFRVTVGDTADVAHYVRGEGPIDGLHYR